MSAPEPLDAALLRRFPLPDHPDGSDKDARGCALIVAGSREVPGAAVLAGLGALRAGAGKLQIATGGSVAPGLGIAMPEARVIFYAETEDGGIARNAVGGLAAECGGVDSLTIGPGMEPGGALAELIGAVLDADKARPLVLDAAALGMLPPLASALRAHGNAILLPHAGEMARLLACEEAEVTADLLAAARKASERYGATVLIKGGISFVATPDGHAFRFVGGGVGLATSGSGDVLAGIVGGLAARGAGPLAATLWGVYLHGEAGRTLSGTLGRVGFLARELPDLVPGLMQRI